ncbi:helix-turn-helix domain-containing protein [Pelagibacterium sp. 26DY04]|uniref:helix-turn-helix domain-containing protein n=1 Tax=Pelagibacterium sp. 26DY04 TaxID=2967130 RepID=UPI002814ABC7|nr:helix-turn-helix domain-containing protein [Pelagibacterium sp. 26DY04]WMT86806.1 helix-turn-helix domain-containing protein [Pelagibacterium sp. 26DY04]
MSSFKQVAALSRGLTILRLVNEENESTVGSIHARSGLDKATIVRMLETLEHEGYVTRSGTGPFWRPTGLTITLASGYSAVRETGRLVSPVMADSREILKWPASFAIFDRDAMIIADTTQDWRGMMVSRHPSHRPPMLTTSLGRAYLAFMDDAEREALLSQFRLNPLGWNRIIAKPGCVEALIADIREKGYALGDEEYITATFGGDIWAIGVPVKGRTKLYGALSLMVLRRVIGPEEGVADLAPRLMAVAPRLAEALGG